MPNTSSQHKPVLEEDLHVSAGQIAMYCWQQGAELRQAVQLFFCCLCT